jgi:hypothetical protein
LCAHASLSHRHIVSTARLDASRSDVDVHIAARCDVRSSGRWTKERPPTASLFAVVGNPATANR